VWKLRGRWGWRDFGCGQQGDGFREISALAIPREVRSEAVSMEVERKAGVV
jgi:hypothetical protein